ncbi:MAG: hypothetical protein K2L70_04675 [Clostridia bacterium]|nr:hypothetical protein [Clostridia bacterium]
MEIVFDLIELVLDLYIAFFQYTAPNEELSKRKRFFLRLICAIVTVAIFVGLILGVYLMIGGNTTELIVGIVLLALAIIGIIAHIAIAVHTSKKKKAISQPLDKEDMDNLYKK